MGSPLEPCLAPAAATATAVFLCGLMHQGGLGDVEVVAAGTGWLLDTSRWRPRRVMVAVCRSGRGDCWMRRAGVGFVSWCGVVMVMVVVEVEWLL